MDFTDFLNHFITLLVIANPLAALPAVLKITQNHTAPQKKAIGLKATFAVSTIFLICVWFGTDILNLIGIDIHSFQVAGAIVVFSLAISMVEAKESPLKQNETQQNDEHSSAIVPLAIPIIAGPGAISLIIVSVSEFPGIKNQFLISISTICVALTMGILLYFAPKISRVLGVSGVNIMNRLGGLILAAIAIQTLSKGIIGLFPILGS
jgi:multiple antibiotic resistance protein